MSVMIRAGFTDPVRDSQTVFRVVLDAMARPGRIHSVAVPSDPPRPLDRASAAVLLTLVDMETPLWMDEHAAAASGWVAFHCGVHLVAAADARFAIALNAPTLTSFHAGTDEEPENSATLILQVAAFDAGSDFLLDGPGCAAPTSFAVSGLTDQFAAEWNASRNLLPRGIDVILCSGDRLAALPRTVLLERT